MEHRSTRQRFAAPQRGLTLVELLITLCILVAVAGLMIPNGQAVVDSSAADVTRASMVNIVKVISSHYAPDMSGSVLVDPTDGSLDEPLIDGLPRPGPWAIEHSLRPPHPQLCYLFVNPQTYEDGNPDNDLLNSYQLSSRRGWRGPYLLFATGTYQIDDASDPVVKGFTANYGSNGDPAAFDGWNRPIILQQAVPGEARLVSAGENGVIDTPSNATNVMLSPTMTKDDIYLTFPVR